MTGKSVLMEYFDERESNYIIYSQKFSFHKLILHNLVIWVLMCAYDKVWMW